jgi:hypothetical protein
MDEAQSSLFDVEHIGAWLMSLVAVVLGVIALLVGFDILDLRSDETFSIGNVAEEVSTVFSNDYWDATMIFFSAFTAGILGYCLHMSDHHRLRDLSTLPSKERGMWTTEHGGAYLFAVASIVLVIIGLLVGFEAFSADHDQRDGLMWIWLGFGSSIVATTLHAVRHHQAVVEQDYIIGVLEERVRATNVRGGVGETGRQPIR